MKSLKNIAKGVIPLTIFGILLGQPEFLNSENDKSPKFNTYQVETQEFLEKQASLEQIAESEQWRSKKGLGGLYQVLAKDIKEGKSIVFTTYLGLWSDGEPPEKNLYWGKKEGHFSMFERAKKDPHIIKNFKNHNWERVYYKKSENDPLRTVVYNMKVEPNNFWKNLGVKDRFDILQVYLVYDDIRKAGRDMTLHLKQDKAKTIKINEKEINLGKDSRIIGYTGHNFYYDGDFPELHQINGVPKDTKAVYSIGCKTASFFNYVWIDKNIYGLLFTTSLMAPEGYNLLSLINSIAQGHDGKEILTHADESYRYFQVLGGQRKPGKLFVNHSHGLFD